MRGKKPRVEIIGAPPEKEARAKEKRGRKAAKHAAHAMGAEYLVEAIDGPAVQPRASIGLVLDLQPRLDVFDGTRDESHSPTRQDAGQSMSKRGKLWRLVRGIPPMERIEDVVIEKATVHRQGAQHAGTSQRFVLRRVQHCLFLHRVHEHPADERRRRAFVETFDAFILDRLHEAVPRAVEPGLVSRLEPDFDGVEAFTWSDSHCCVCTRQMLTDGRLINVSIGSALGRVRT